jgi:hypothetical protein
VGAGAIPKRPPHREIIGRNFTSSFSSGDSITAEQIVSTTPKELVALKLTSLSAQPLIDDWSDEYELRFSRSRFRERLPDWAAEYISEVNQELAIANGEWAPEMWSVIASLDSLIHVWQEDDDWDLEIIGKRLFEGVRSHAASNDPSINRHLLSADFLSRLARTHGKIPVSIFDLDPLSGLTVRKLQLLREMLENNADGKWIGQEQVRLAGLLDATPAQAIRLLLTAGEIKYHYAMEHWIHALSSVEIYSEVNASPREYFAVPVDPVLMIALLAARVGESKQIDTHISLVLREVDPANMLNRPLNNILSGTSGYREYVYEALSTMYRKSQSKELKTAIMKLAPGASKRIWE